MKFAASTGFHLGQWTWPAFSTSHRGDRRAHGVRPYTYTHHVARTVKDGQTGRTTRATKKSAGEERTPRFKLEWGRKTPNRGPQHLYMFCNDGQHGDTWGVAIHMWCCGPLYAGARHRYAVHAFRRQLVTVMFAFGHCHFVLRHSGSQYHFMIYASLIKSLIVSSCSTWNWHNMVFMLPCMHASRANFYIMYYTSWGRHSCVHVRCQFSVSLMRHAVTRQLFGAFCLARGWIDWGAK